MKLICTLLFASALFASCAKEDYTCNCTDTSGRVSSRTYMLSERSQSKAVKACDDRQTDLNVSNTNYRCTLAP